MRLQPEGISLHYTDTGPENSASVLLLHGGGSSNATWARLTAELAVRGYRVIAPDLRGHGASPRSADYRLLSYHTDVDRMLTKLNLGALDVVGHSLGGYIALTVAQQAPARVRRLIVEEPAAPSQGGRRRHVSRARMVLGGLRHRRFDPAAIRSVITELGQPDDTWWHRLPGITAPTLLLRGGPGSHLDQGDLAAIGRLIPHCQQITIPVGHRIHSGAPETFNAAVLTFLSTCDAGDSEEPAASRESQRPDSQEEGCPSVGAVGEADDARDGRDAASGATRDAKEAEAAVLPWVDQALQAGSRGS
jgi:pimeloyl-ACP methyl ester carboxylesterase